MPGRARVGRPKGTPKTGGRKKGTPNKATVEIKAFAREFLARPAYRKSLQRRVDAGKAPHMEPLLHYYAHGKPKETFSAEGAGEFIFRWKGE